MAFPTPGTSPATWFDGTWETADGTYIALCLVGASGTASLAKGTCDVWVQVTDNPEIPALLAGTRTVTV